MQLTMNDNLHGLVTSIDATIERKLEALWAAPAGGPHAESNVAGMGSGSGSGSGSADICNGPADGRAGGGGATPSAAASAPREVGWAGSGSQPPGPPAPTQADLNAVAAELSALREAVGLMESKIGLVVSALDTTGPSYSGIKARPPRRALLRGASASGRMARHLPVSVSSSIAQAETGKESTPSSISTSGVRAEDLQLAAKEGPMNEVLVR